MGMGKIRGRAGYGNVEDKGGLVLGVWKMRGMGWLWKCGR